MHADLRDIRDNAPPSGMQRSTDFAFRVDQQNRHAVCREYSQYHAGLGSDEAVTRRPQPRSIASGRVNVVAMYLVQARDDFQIGHRATKAIPVLIDGALVV